VCMEDRGLSGLDPARTAGRPDAAESPNYIFPTFRSDSAIKPLFNLGKSDTYPFGFVLPQIPLGQFDSRGGLVGARPDT